MYSEKFLVPLVPGVVHTCPESLMLVASLPQGFGDIQRMHKALREAMSAHKALVRSSAHAQSLHGGHMCPQSLDEVQRKHMKPRGR